MAIRKYWGTNTRRQARHRARETSPEYLWIVSMSTVLILEGEGDCLYGEDSQGLSHSAHVRDAVTDSHTHLNTYPISSIETEFYPG